ncbi:MAG: dockerin type I repeat-containing protein [Clostridia bacterium]|nr:dockerin type I repeat-containing protein [Clostridia bacterium]
MKIMRRFLAAALVLVMLASALSVFASADVLKKEDTGLPFDLVAPAYVTAVWGEGGDSPTTTNVTYSLSNEMTTFFKNLEKANLDEKYEEFMSPYNFDEIWMNIQLDWALDDVNDEISGWHYTKYWDGDPYFGLGHDSEGNPRWSDWDVVDWGLNNATETVQDIWVTRGVPNDERWNGNPERHIPGVKDQLRPEQYVYDEEEETLYIDFTKHTMYYRMRFVVTTRTEREDETWYFSDWSNVAMIGKNAKAYEPLTQKDLSAPVLTDLHMTDQEFNGHAVIALTLTVPDKLAEDAAYVEAWGGVYWIEAQARFRGDTEWVGLQGDWIIKGGEMEFALMSLSREDHVYVKKTDEIELRLRYYVYQRETDTEMWSEWSEINNFSGGDDVLRGDVNEDGEVNNKDVVYLFRSLSSSGVNINRILADFNEDGEVDNKDVVALFRYVSTHTEIRI